MQLKIKKTAQGSELLDDASNYDSTGYKRAINTVDICICRVKDMFLEVLLVKRRHPPFKGKWAVPGGFVDFNKNEGLLDAAKRELLEETGVKNVPIHQLGTYGDDPKRDPRDRVITTVYYALMNASKLKKQKIIAADDALEYKWCFLSKYIDLAFDHRDILSDLRHKLEKDIKVTPIAFQLVPRDFTWTELRMVYQGVLGYHIRAQNFPRDIKSLYEIKDLGKVSKRKKQGKPAKLFRFVKVKDNF